MTERETQRREVSAAFAQRLEQLREARGFSRRHLCGLAGVDASVYWHWEKGDAMPKITTLYRLADALGVKPGEMLPSRPFD